MTALKALMFAGGLLMATAPANSASLCNCCETGMAETCKATCAAITLPVGQCVAAVDFGGATEIAAGENPLYSISLRGMHLAGAPRKELEDFRRLLEAARAGAEKDRKAAVANFKRKKINAATAAIAAKRYDEAIVNYYLGLRAYRDSVKLAAGQ
jgi:hypothetical protein